MSEWEYYYLDETDDPVYAGGLFQFSRIDIEIETGDKTETISLGSVNLDFRNGELVGIEIWQDASKLIEPGLRKAGKLDQEAEKIVDTEKIKICEEHNTRCGKK